MWKVAKIHFCLTIALILFVALSLPMLAGSSVHTHWLKEFVWSYSVITAGICLQPISYFLWASGIYFPALVMIPVWSYCFGWIFICGKDWINHFPVLGRKVF
jgi:hypothetical protein